MSKTAYRLFMSEMARKFSQKALNAADAKNPTAATAYFKLSLRAASESLVKPRG
jgi:hypothetical protein